MQILSKDRKVEEIKDHLDHLQKKLMWGEIQLVEQLDVRVCACGIKTRMIPGPEMCQALKCGRIYSSCKLTSIMR